MNNDNYRVEGLSIELKYTGEDKEYDLSYWTRICGIKSMSRKELSVIIDRIQDVIQEEYLKDRLEDIRYTVECRDIQLKQLPYKPEDLDNFLE